MGGQTFLPSFVKFGKMVQELKEEKSHTTQNAVRDTEMPFCRKEDGQHTVRSLTQHILYQGVLYFQNAIRFYSTVHTISSRSTIKVLPFPRRLSPNSQMSNGVMCTSHPHRPTNVDGACQHSVNLLKPTGHMMHHQFNP